MGSWGPPLRIARRTTRRNLGRTLLVAALIGLPVLAASWLGVTARTASPTGEALARVSIGQADARLTVTPYDKLQEIEGGPILEAAPAPSDGHQTPVRLAETFDPLSVLPAGSTAVRALTEAGAVDIKGLGTNTSVTVMIGDGQSPLAKDMSSLNDGRFPAALNEVAVSPALAKYLGISTGDTLQDAKGTSYQVVGLARPRWAPNDRWIIAPAGTALTTPSKNSEVSWLVDLPDSADPAALSTALSDKGFYLVPRANIVHPPLGPYSTIGGNYAPYAAVALAIGFGMLEVVLLAGTAFAVGARRQTRELGLVLTAGGTPRDIRRIVLLQGLFAGVVGVIAGLVLAAAVLLAGRPLWEAMRGRLFSVWQIPWTEVLLIAALGLFSGVAAAIVPALSASRQPPMAALSGRFAATVARTTIRKRAVAMIIAGVVAVVIGSGLLATALADARTRADQGGYPRSSANPTGPVGLVLLGITAVVVGLVWILPSIMGKLAGQARHLPLSGRMALRDAARHRHRTGPATAAIMMAVAATAAASFAATNSVASDKAAYVPQSQLGNANLRFGADQSDAVPYSTDLEQGVAAQLSAKGVFHFGMITAADQPAGAEPESLRASPDPTYTGPQQGLLAVDPAYLDLFGDAGRKLGDRLRAGDMLVPQPGYITTNSVQLDTWTPEGPTIVGRHPASYAGPFPKIDRLQDQVLISTAEAAKLGKVSTDMVEFKLTRPPTDEDLLAVDRIVRRQGLLVVEQGYQDPSRYFLFGIIGASAVVTLLGVAISVSLSAAEGRADLATLAAIGAPPRRRRSLAAAQAWMLGQLGCVLGVGVGALYGYTAHSAFGSPHFAVPWVELASIVVVVPLFAGLVAWASTRSRLPMVARID